MVSVFPERSAAEDIAKTLYAYEWYVSRVVFAARELRNATEAQRVFKDDPNKHMNWNTAHFNSANLRKEGAYYLLDAALKEMDEYQAKHPLPDLSHAVQHEIVSEDRDDVDEEPE